MSFFERLKRWLGSADENPQGAGSLHEDPARKDSAPPVVPKKLVVGLGNPGEKYRATRHNIGFRVVERLAEQGAASWRSDSSLRGAYTLVSVDGLPVGLLAPETFMNKSGEAVEAALARWPSLDPEADLLIVFDDLDLPVGRIRLRPKGGGGGHNGIGDILGCLETRNLARLRFGIGHPGSAAPVIDWVLGPFAADEEAELLPETLGRACDAARAWASQGIGPAMSTFNAAGE